MDHTAQVTAVTARLDDLLRRYEADAPRRAPLRARGTTARARRIADMALYAVLAIAALMLAATISGVMGEDALAIIVALAVAALFFAALRPTATTPIAPYREDMAGAAVVRRFASLIAQRRGALPASAAQRLDGIAATLPLLEQRLAEVNPLDPVAQDARRLMGQHLPDLLDRYERVPRQYRREQDGDGVSVDERLLGALGAARIALDDLARDLSRDDVAAFETQGRFLETRYAAGEQP